MVFAVKPIMQLITVEQTASLGSVTVTTGTTYPKFNAAVRAQAIRQ